MYSATGDRYWSISTFHVKQLVFLFILILDLLVFAQIDSLEKQSNRVFLYEPFLREYRFKIFVGRKAAGYINLTISTTTDGGFFSIVEGKTEIPILFFLGDTETSEVEYYDQDFVPIKSTLVTLKDDTEVITTTELLSKEGDYYRYRIFRKAKKHKEIELNLTDGSVITAGNAIPKVSATWDFFNVRSKTFKLIDKQFLKISKIKFNYLGETEAGEHKIEVVLPYVSAKFYIYVDGKKNIKHAEGMGLKVIAE